MKPLIILSAIAGILLLIVAGVYAAFPAHSLPTFFPGYEVGLARHHYTHAVASFGIALVCFAFAWMQSGKK